MAATGLDIKTDEGSLELLQEAESTFYITRQIHDLNNFESRNADYTKTIQLPATPKNYDLLKIGTANKNTLTTGQESKIKVSIFMDGLIIAPEAWLLHNKTIIKRGFTLFEIVIFYGNFNLFDALSGDSIAALDWSDLAINWDPIPLRDASENTTDLVFPVCDWVTRSSNAIINYPFISVSKSIEVNAAGFFMYAREIIRRMLLEAGFTLVVHSSVPQEFNQIALACPIEKFIELTNEEQLAVSSNVSKTIIQIVDGATERAIFQNVVSDSSGIWNSSLNHFQMGGAVDIKATIAGTYSMDNGQSSLPPSYFAIYMNRNTVVTELARIEFPDNATEQTFYLPVEFSVIVGDLIYCEIVASNGGNDDVLTMHILSEFSVSTSGLDVSRLIQPSDHIPQITQSTFLSNILKLYNLLIVTNDITKEVTLFSFNVLYTNPENDLSRRLSAGDNEIEVANSISSLAQESSFKWLNDNLRRRDTDVVLSFGNQLLSKEKTVIQMDFSACDNSLLHFDTDVDTYAKAKIPNAELELNDVTGAVLTITDAVTGAFSIDVDSLDFYIGDWFVLQLDTFTYRFYRVVEYTDSQTGRLQISIENDVVNTPRPITRIVKASAQSMEPRLAIMRSDGGETSYNIYQGSPLNLANFTANSLTANWMDSLKWGEIVNNQYKNILDGLQSPQIITAKFNLAALEVLQANFTRPVYINQFNAFYYLNRIIQFKPNALTTVELVRISKILD